MFFNSWHHYEQPPFCQKVTNRSETLELRSLATLEKKANRLFHLKYVNFLLFVVRPECDWLSLAIQQNLWGTLMGSHKGVQTCCYRDTATLVPHQNPWQLNAGLNSMWVGWHNYIYCTCGIFINKARFCPDGEFWITAPCSFLLLILKLTQIWICWSGVSMLQIYEKLISWFYWIVLNVKEGEALYSLIQVWKGWRYHQYANKTRSRAPYIIPYVCLWSLFELKQ